MAKPPTKKTKQTAQPGAEQKVRFTHIASYLDEHGNEVTFCRKYLTLHLGSEEHLAIMPELARRYGVAAAELAEMVPPLWMLERTVRPPG